MSETVVGALRRRYGLALVLFAALATAAFGALHFGLDDQASFAPLINRAGQQRMLSQRIGILAARFAAASPEEERATRGRLRSALDRFEDNHAFVVDTIRVRSFPDAHDMYFRSENSIDEQAHRHLRRGRRLLSMEPADRTAIAEALRNEAADGELLARLDEAVAVFERASQERVSENRRTALAILLVTLLTLALVARFNFEPMARSVAAATESLRRAKGDIVQFAHRSTRDLMEPLASIETLGLSAESDLAEGEVERAAEGCRSIVEQSRQISRSVAGIVDFVGADLETSDAGAVLLSECFDAALGELHESVREAGVTVRREATTSTPVGVPRTRMVQIVRHLIANGIEHRNPDRPMPYVELSARDEQPGVVVRVSDNGTGIPAEIANELRSRENDSSSRWGAAAGLGLAVVYRHVEAVGGTLSFESTNQGTAFEMVLPSAGFERR